MRRLLFALASTAAGLAAVLSFKTHSSAVTSNVAAAAGAQSGMSSTSSGTPTGTTTGTGTATGTGSAAGTGSAKGTATAKGTGSAARTGSATAAPKSSTTGGTGGAAAGPRTIVGTVDNTQYGPMQVEVILQGTKITNVKVLQQTNVGGMSQQIDANAIPQLVSETLTAQSARINAVSGASYTSAGYIQSLQSALDKA